MPNDSTAVKEPNDSAAVKELAQLRILKKALGNLWD
jgi:hypothetical protein